MRDLRSARLLSPQSSAASPIHDGFHHLRIPYEDVPRGNIHGVATSRLRYRTSQLQQRQWASPLAKRIAEVLSGLSGSLRRLHRSPPKPLIGLNRAQHQPSMVPVPRFEVTIIEWVEDVKHDGLSIFIAIPVPTFLCWRLLFPYELRFTLHAARPFDQVHGHGMTPSP